MQLYTVLNKTRNICLVFLFNQNCSTVFRVFHFNMHENSKYMVHICTSQGQFQKQSVRLGVRLFSIKDIHLNNFFFAKDNPIQHDFCFVQSISGKLH